MCVSPGDLYSFAVVVDLTLTLDTNQYAAGDVLSDTVSLGNIARIPGGPLTLISVTVIDEDDQKAALTLIFLDTLNSLGTANSAANISDANARKILGHVKIVAGDYVDAGGVSIACVRNVQMLLQAAPGSQAIYLGTISDGTGTYTASGLKLKLGFRRS